MSLPTFPGAELIVWWSGWQQGIDGFAHNPVVYAEAVTCPVLLMNGEHDQRVTQADIESIFDHLPAEKTLVLFPSVGHGQLVSEAPIKWQQHVNDFLTPYGFK